MLKRGALIFVFLILISSVLALSSDFNNDNKVDFDDFFLFAENFQKEVNKENEKFDLDKNNKIDVEDFFIFAEEFEKISLAGDFDNNGCVENKDLELAVKELKIIYDQKAKYSFSVVGNYPDDFSVKSNDRDYNDNVQRLVSKYDLNNDGYIFSIEGQLREDKVNLAKKDLEIFKKEIGKGCARDETSTKLVDIKLLRAYHFDYEKFRDKQIDFLDGHERKYRLKVNADDVINDEDTFEFSDEEYEAIAREDGFVVQSFGSNTELLVFRAPSEAKEIIVSYLFKSGHNIRYGASLYPKLNDGFDTYAYKIGSTKVNFNGYGAVSGEIKLPVENGKAYLIAGSGLITWPVNQYYYFIDRIGVV